MNRQISQLQDFYFFHIIKANIEIVIYYLERRAALEGQYEYNVRRGK